MPSASRSPRKRAAGAGATGCTRSGAVRVSVVADARAAAESGGGYVAAVARGAADDRCVVAEVDVHDVGDDAGDVVRPPPRSASSMRRSAHSLRVDVGAQGLRQRLVADDAGEPVAAQQVAVAGAGLPHRERRIDVVPGQRAQQQRALRVGVRLLLGDAAFVDQRLDERVVLRDLGEHGRRASGRPGSRRRAPGPAGSRRTGSRSAWCPCPRGRAASSDRPVIAELPSRVASRSSREQVVAGVVVVERGQCRDHQLGGDLTRGVAAHAVGKRQQPRPGIDRVLVVLPNQAAVAAGGVPKTRVMSAARSPSCRCGSGRPGAPEWVR